MEEDLLTGGYELMIKDEDGSGLMKTKFISKTHAESLTIDILVQLVTTYNSAHSFAKRAFVKKKWMNFYI